MTLDELPIGKTATVSVVGGSGELRQHFLDMGIIPTTDITMVKYAPMGDPVEVRIKSYELSLRVADAKQIEIRDVRDGLDAAHGTENRNAAEMGREAAVREGKGDRHNLRQAVPHPGLGEGGKYHVKADEHPVPDGTILTFALAGNQNCGKTTLFNQLTGSNQHVGNFPGVTVDRKDGAIRGFKDTLVTDLPGIYSMSPYTDEEIVSRQFILDNHPKGIINIVDATNIERNLYLTMQLMELNIPMVIALNMMDEVRENGGSILINKMEEMLGVPVVPISAAKNEGISELIDHAIHVAKYQERPGRQDFCSETEDGGAVHRCLHGIMHLIQDHAQKADIPLRFAASKVVEGDERVINRLNLDQNEKEMIEHIVQQMEKERGLDRSAAMADMRFDFINRVCSACVVKPRESKGHIRSQKIDKILTGKYTAIPMFVLIMGLVFYLTFNVIGSFLQNLLQAGIDALGAQVSTLLSQTGASSWIKSLVVDAIFSGVGTVLSFIPLIVVLFFFLSILEDSGYMARVAFVMDKPLRKIGLSGRSIVPMLVGFGCTVPGVMASRTLPSERDRKMTILLTPFMSCSAKVPIYVFLSVLFFPRHAGLVVVLLYLMGILTGVLVAWIFKKTTFRGEAVPFVMELPNYRMPSPKNVLQLMWDKAKDFLQRAFTVIFLATLVIWFLQNFGTNLNIVEDSSKSILAVIAGAVAPIFKPMGLGDWRIVTSLIAGFMAKESVVSTLNLVFGSRSAITAAITPLAGFCLLVFCLLYTPCVAAVSSVRRELGTKWMFFVIINQCVIAWIAAFVVSLVGRALGLAI